MLRCSQRWQSIHALVRHRTYTGKRQASTWTAVKQFALEKVTIKNRPLAILRALRAVKYGCFGLLGLHVFWVYGYSLTATYGVSMLPTLYSAGEWVVTDKYYRRGRGVHVGDLVSFKSPIREGEHAVKRVIGLSGDFVLMNTPGKSDTMIQVPEGHCWVVGDNVKHSRDSRIWGPLPMALIVGKITAKFTWWHWCSLPRDFTWFEGGLQPSPDVDDVD